MDDTVKPGRTPRAHPKNTVVESFGEDPSRAARRLASEPSGSEVERTPRPAHGRSDTLRVYRLWTREEETPQSGHAAVADTDLAVISTISASADTCSLANPGGIKDEGWRLRLMLLILFANQRKTTSQRHQN